MAEISRTEYSARNTTVAMLSRILAIVMGYFTRVVFTHVLSSSYVGVSGLFTEILNVLALSELGVGTAITYALYRPIAEGDTEKQKSLMRLFQKLYQAVAVIIAVGGLCLVPFLGYIVRDAGDVEHIIAIYLLYLLNSVVSYLFVYKRTLMDAYQLGYVGVLYQMIFQMVQYVLQIVILLTTKNFILYLLIMLFCTVAANLSTAYAADRRYPYLRQKSAEPLPKEERSEIFRNIRAMMMHKIGNVVVNNTDNILLSAMVGIFSAGQYSNNYLIIGSVRQLINQTFQGIAASVGNLGATENESRVKEIFETCFFIGQWLYGFAAVCLFELLGPFVQISFGSLYELGRPIVFVLALNFYVTGMRQAVLIFRDSMGLFWYDRFKAPVEAVINLAVSVVLTLQFGMVGVFLGTFISTMLTSFWVEPYVFYKKKLHESPAPYFFRYAVYTVAAGAVWLLTDLVCRQFAGDAQTVFLLRIPVCLILPNVLMLVCYWRLREFVFLRQKLAGLLRERTGIFGHFCGRWR